MAKKAKPKRLTKAEIAEKFKDPLWRLERSGLYWIVSKDKDEYGRDISKFEPFRPFHHQTRLFKKLYTDGCKRLLIPKARRMGFSTAINLSQFDFCLNEQDWHSRIVDQSESDAKDKLVNRVTKAWDYLDSKVQTGLTTLAKSGEEIKWSNGSRFTASISGRGSEAAHFLHVSELGPIDFKDAKRADEIIDGALPAADAGIQVIESTAKGPVGHFKRLVDQALAVPLEERTQYDWEVMFFAWHDDPRHTMVGKFTRVSHKVNEYLDYVQDKIGHKINEQQRIWYQVTSEKSNNVKYEYPSLLEECWEQPVEGAIYANDINEARGDGRVGKFPHDERLPVYTIWDLGAPDNMRCIFFQQLMGEIRVIDAQMGGYDEMSKIDGPRTPGDWAEVLRERRYGYASHIMPHDGNIKQYGGTTFKTDLEKAGIRDIKIMEKRGKDPWQRIRSTRGAIKRFVFNTQSPGVDILLKHLSAYHTKTEHDGITIQELPHHNWASHYADAFSSIVEAIDRAFTGGNSGYGGNRKKRQNKPRLKAYSSY